MDLKELKSAARSNLEKLSNRVKRLAPGTIYGSLCASTLWPVISAAGLGDFGAVGALCGVLGSMGGGLVGARIQEWRARSEEDLATELGKKAKDDPEWREALDKLLEEFDAPRIVQGALTGPDKEWFARTLKDELSKLGNLDRYQAMLVGDGAIAQGDGAVADEALARVRSYLRLAVRWGWLSDRQYRHVAAMVVEIGRLLGGWQRVTL